MFLFNKSSWTDNNFWAIINTVLTNTISKKDTQFLHKMIKPLILKRKSLNSSIEELWTQELIMKEETQE